ncbi:MULTISPECIES: glucarate dehydratase family protein [Paraburkholderia]|uniref:glucarate dehydratase family protein n=1 Tax=Paraburkholderia TaxID=1822464 RepID=UPI00224D8CBF|nr:MULTISPECIES: glucarate dehydratase family protein [Paraburkholderia]MCX4160665.1 glucarate dehydratase family protein [Paraburkholderia megapolitana]MDN7156163.1 glucarate dehydratase family protein [Paraburkholderia sp. CHISQ3]MDQ6493207.1 glucarate dehydratase family protein [Paraburkholderia megapolitana]
MKIAAVRITPIAVSDSPLLNASGVHEPYALRSIIEVEADNGLVGLGETYGDKPVLDSLTRVKDSLTGLSPFDLNGLWQRVHAAGRSAVRGVELDVSPGSQASHADQKIFGAFEVAFLDLQARSLGIPVHELLGGAVRRQVPFSAYLFFKFASDVDPSYRPDTWGETLDEAQLVTQARTMIDRHGFGSIKLKAGALEPEHEVACLKALKRAFPNHPLRIDPNANWSLDTAIRMAGQLQGDLEYYEDPTPGLEGMAALHKATGLPLATNMVVTNLTEFRRNIALNGVQIVLSDHHYWGGLRATQTLAAMCDTFGLGLSMHSNSHLGISLMAMSHLAAAVPNLTYACDTHYPWQNEEVIKGGKVAITGGCVTVTDEPGLGVELDHDALGALHEQYLRCGLVNRDDATQMRKLRPDWSLRRPRF